ncbi:YqjF family protein [Pedobacter deserti]|uniref:YqjF family protein n=1 Tax=Pedobacter deserti TaxID=2817382 RepID=UPI00210B419F|nr:DUF2071 domain-containing protein [Pedobacter sp. SYSU D00382]
MSTIADILSTTSHRQYDLPEEAWKHYQEWHQNLFLHWKLPLPALRPFVPEGLTIDTIHGDAWISFVAFSVKNLRPRFLPPFPLISDFHELNLRTYVIKDGIPGIYFLSIEAEKLVPALMARLLLGLPYFKSAIKRDHEKYSSRNLKRNLSFLCSYKVGPPITSKTALDYWLTERHALFEQRAGSLYRLDIHHKPWPIRNVSLHAQITGYPLVGTDKTDGPHLVHYADRVTVLLWGVKP